MKKSILTLGLITLTLFSCKNDGQTESKTVETNEVDTNMAIPDSATISKAWTDYATQGEAHKMMTKDNGIWEEEVTSWMHAGAKPLKNKMTAEIKSVFDGKYQEATHKGDFFGMPFEGKSTLAYDNAAKEYISTWIDNMSTGIIVMKGTYDAKTKTYAMNGECIDPVTKKVNKKREVITMTDENTQKMEMFDTGYDGKEFKSMEIIMKRKK